MQRSSRCFAEPGPRFPLSKLDPGSAAHRSARATRCAASGARRLALLLGDDLVLDAVIGLLRDDVLVHQIVLALVGTPRDDLGRIRLADAGQRVELV